MDFEPGRYDAEGQDIFTFKILEVFRTAEPLEIFRGDTKVAVVIHPDEYEHFKKLIRLEEKLS